MSFLNKDINKKENRAIYLDVISPQTAISIHQIVKKFNEEDNEKEIPILKREPICIYINSLGGELFSALTILDSISMSKTPIYTYNIGIVYKESFLIYMAGHKRYCYSNSHFLYSPSIIENLLENEEYNFYNKTTMINNLKKNIKIFLLDIINISENQYDKFYNNNWFFSSDDALKIHISNEICNKY